MLKNRQESTVNMNQDSRAPDHTREVVGPCYPGLKALTTTRKKNSTVPASDEQASNLKSWAETSASSHPPNQYNSRNPQRGVHLLQIMPKMGEKVHPNGGVKHTLLGINAVESSSLECMSPNIFITKDPTMLD